MLDTPTHPKRNDTLTLGVASVAPILFSIHLYGIQTNAYAPGTVDHLILPAYLVTLSTSLVAAKLAFKTSKSSESVTNMLAKLVSTTSLVFLRSWPFLYFYWRVSGQAKPEFSLRFFSSRG